MRTVGFLLTVSGWLIAIAAVALLAAGAAQLAFLLITLAIQVTGLVLIARSHKLPVGRPR